MIAQDSPTHVIRNYKDMVYRIAFVKCKNFADAEDITQDVFLKFLKKTPDVSSEEHLKAWLIRVTINASNSFLRSAWLRKIVPLSQQVEHRATQSNGSDQSAVLSAVLSLPEKYRAVTLLYYFDDFSIREISETLGRTETAVQTQLYRARALLRDILSEEWNND